MHYKCLSVGLFLAGHLAAGTYYVASNGSNSGTGSAASPWKTIEYAAANIPDDGSTVIVKSGMYSGRIRMNRIFTKKAYFRSEIPYKARLTATSEVLMTVYGGANFEVSGFEFMRSQGATGLFLVHLQNSTARNVTFRNNIFHDSYNNDLVKINNGASNIIVEDNVFYNQSGSDEHLDINGVVNVVIRDNVFFNDFKGSGRTNANNTSSFIVIKNSARLPENHDITVQRNVFLNWEGSVGQYFVLVGEDGRSGFEAERVMVENNLLIGNSANTMRAPFGVKGARDVTFRNNTVTGNLPSNAFGMRLNREGSNPVNERILFYNNIWSDPTGTMNDFSDGLPAETSGAVMKRNVFWNRGAAIPADLDVLNYFDDKEAILGNPVLPAISTVVLPRWNGSSFLSGSTSIAAEHSRLVNAYGVPGSGSVAIDAADPAQSPAEDILGRPRGTKPDVGAVEQQGESPTSTPTPTPSPTPTPTPTTITIDVSLSATGVLGGTSSTSHQVLLSSPAPAGGVVVPLATSDPTLATVPQSVTVPQGQTSAFFTIQTKRVSTTTPVALRTTYGGVARYLCTFFVRAAQ